MSKDQAYIDKMLAKYYYQWKDWVKLGKVVMNWAPNSITSAAGGYFYVRVTRT